MTNKIDKRELAILSDVFATVASKIINYRELCNQVYLAERKMETLCSSKFEFFLAEKILVNKTFKGLKLENSDFFIATRYDESKKITSNIF